MEYNGNFSPQTFVIYVPYNVFPVPPTPTASNPDWLKTNYYFIYAYVYMLDFVNTAIATAFASIPFGAPVGSLPPYFIYDPITQRISLIAQKSFYDLKLATPVKLYMNTALQNFFDAIPVTFLGYDNTSLHPATDGRNFLFRIYDQGYNYYYPPKNQNIINNTTATALSETVGAVTYTTDITWYKMTQEYICLQYWHSFKNIVFTTSTIPIAYEQTSYNQSGTNKSQSNYIPILTDFSPLTEASGSVRSIFEYLPQAQYRLIDLYTHSPMRKIDMQLYWQDNNDTLYPIFIQNNNSISVKLLFAKKSLYKNAKINL